MAILEPTGNHYSRVWAQIIESLGIKILWVGHIELRRYRGGKNLPNKSDEADALAMAAYAQDQEISLYKDTLKNKVDASGKQLLNGKHLQNKLMSKVTNILFRELSRAIVVKLSTE